MTWMNGQKADFCIVGSGLFGAVWAQQCREHGKTCIVLERRAHPGGNVWSKHQFGIDVHQYGPHILHTDSAEIWAYANRFSPFNSYRHRVIAHTTCDNYYSFPINLLTLQQVFGLPAYDALRAFEKERVKTVGLAGSSFRDEALKRVGPTLYDFFFDGYTRKQWGRPPESLPASYAKRIPVRTTFDDSYHTSKYSGVPLYGYSTWIGNMLGNTRVELGVDFNKEKGHWRDFADRLVYSGSLDELYDYDLGKLEYRTLEFDYRVEHGDQQGVAQINHCDAATPHTRTVEYRHFNPVTAGPESVLSDETPDEWEPGRERYYPVRTPVNDELQALYKTRAEADGLVVGGRLGSYQYNDMAPTIAAALLSFRKANPQSGGGVALGVTEPKP